MQFYAFQFNGDIVLELATEYEIVFAVQTSFFPCKRRDTFLMFLKLFWERPFFFLTVHEISIKHVKLFFLVVVRSLKCFKIKIVL